MLTENRDNLRDLDGTELLEVADFLCHQSPIVRPIFECIKVFARLHESGNFTYARVPSDLGSQVVSAIDMSARMKHSKRCAVVLQALEVVENNCHESWPFSAGSSSWVLLEILHPEIRIAGSSNSPTVVFRKAVRLSPRGIPSTSPLLERMFNSFHVPEGVQTAGWQFKVDPTAQLWNVSGDGVFTRLREQVEGMIHLSESNDLSGYKTLLEIFEKTTSEFVDDLLESNFSGALVSNPGFYFDWKDRVYQVRGSKFAAKKKSTSKQRLAPLPILGVIR